MTSANNIHGTAMKPISGLTVAVPTPFNGADLTILPSPGGTLALAFDPITASAIYHEGANDLVFVLAGGKVTISGFFTVADEGLPDFKLPDGSIITGSDFLAGGFGRTAAGASESRPPSGGMDEYDDDPGNLIDGIDRLGSLGTIYWDRSTEIPEIYLDYPHHASGMSTPPTLPSPLSPDGVPASPPLPPPATYIKAFGADLQVHEDVLSWGTNARSTDHSTSTRGYVEIISYSGIGSITFSVDDVKHTITLPAGWDGGIPYAPGSEGTFAAALGMMTIDRVAYNPDTGNYEAHFIYTLQSSTTAHSHSGASDSDHHDRLSQGEPAAQAAMPIIGVVVKDTAGSSSDSSTIAIDVYDDGPKLSLSHVDTGYQADSRWVDDGLIHLSNSYMTTGVITPDYGADRAFGGGSHYLQVAFGKPTEADSAKPLWVEFDDNGKAAMKTLLGTIEFTRQGENLIAYQYIAGSGQAGESEKIIFTVMDGDQDIAGKSMIVMLDQTMPAGASRVDEAALVNRGSFHEGHEAATQSFSVFLPKGATKFAWDIETIKVNSINSIKADVDGDGVYTKAVWSEDDSGNLIAMAEGKLVLTVTPPQSGENGLILHQSGDGRWYGTMEVTLKYPVQHTAPPSGTESDYNVKDLSLGFNAAYTKANGSSMIMSNAVSVAIMDDAPIASGATPKIVEVVPPPEDVYLIMDVSGSIDREDLTKGMKALTELVQKYTSEGIEAKFSLVVFGDSVKSWGTHLPATEMLAVLGKGLNGMTSDDIASYWRSGVGGSTNYDSALDLTQHLIVAAQQDGTLRYYDQKVYFVSDGAPNTGIDKGFGSWRAFIQKHGADTGNERVEVYAVGVGTALNKQNAWDTLMEVTADGSDHGIRVNNYADLALRLTSLIESGKTTGNLFGVGLDNNDIHSADLTTVVSVTVAGTIYQVQASGETVTIPVDNGVTLKVYANGDYTITSTRSVNRDQTYDLKYTIKDADNDTSTAALQLVIKDAKPEAFDNVAGNAVTYAKDEPIMLGDFGSNSSGWLSANANTTYGKTLSGVSFAQILPQANTAAYIDFDKALSYATGKAVTQTFENTKDSPRFGSYIENSFDLLAEGTIKLNYTFTHGTGSDANTQEKAFWILLDGNGNVHKSGLIASTSQISSDLITVDVENAGRYTLILGCYDTHINPTGNTMPTLYVEQVLYTPAEASDIYHGNVIEDNSPQGETDTLGDHAVLHNIHFTDMNNNVHEYTVGEGAFATGLLVLKDMFTHGDKLTINDNGNYVYQAPTGRSFDNANIEYSLKEPGSSDVDSAMLYIRSGGYRHEGNDVNLSGLSGSHVIIGSDTANLLIGSTGDDIIFGGAGNDIIYGGPGNNIMYGGEGSNNFAWREGDYDGGKDVIKDYTLGTDRLSFARIFGADTDGNIPLKTILAAVQNDKIDISVDAQNDSLLKVTVNGGTHSQNVEIHLSDSSRTSTQIDGINIGEDAAKAILLQQMLINITS